MTQRTLAGILAVPLLIGAVARGRPACRCRTSPTSPGLTVDVLGTNDDGKEIIEVSGAPDLPRRRASSG